MAVLFESVNKISVETKAMPGMHEFVIIIQLGGTKVKVKFVTSMHGKECGVLVLKIVHLSLNQSLHLTCLNID